MKELSEVTAQPLSPHQRREKTTAGSDQTARSTAVVTGSPAEPLLQVTFESSRPATASRRLQLIHKAAAGAAQPSIPLAEMTLLTPPDGATDTATDTESPAAFIPRRAEH